MPPFIDGLRMYEGYILFRRCYLHGISCLFHCYSRTTQDDLAPWTFSATLSRALGFGFAVRKADDMSQSNMDIHPTSNETMNGRRQMGVI